MEHAELTVEAFENGPFMENCYIVAERTSGAALLVDPGDEEKRLLARVRELGLTVQGIVNTHAHIDHMGAVAPLKRLLGVPFAMHQGDQPVLASAPVVAGFFGLRAPEVPEVDRWLAHGDTVTVGAIDGQVLHTPGHSPGGCCFYFPRQAVLITGDTLFAGSIGRTDLPGGDLETLLASLRERILTLPDEVTVYSGHGPSTTVGRERRANPYLQGDFEG